jgi:hypothetical protein
LAGPALGLVLFSSNFNYNDIPYFMLYFVTKYDIKYVVALVEHVVSGTAWCGTWGVH